MSAAYSLFATTMASPAQHTKPVGYRKTYRRQRCRIGLSSRPWAKMTTGRGWQGSPRGPLETTHVPDDHARRPAPSPTSCSRRCRRLHRGNSQFATATCGAIRAQVGAQVRRSVHWTKIVTAWACPYPAVHHLAHFYLNHTAW